MDAARWDKIQSLFHSVADLPAEQHRTFLDAQCTEDPSLVDDVMALVAEDARPDSLLDRGVATAAHQVFDRTTFSPPTESFGHYRITRMLGEGGMGVVYLAERDDVGGVAAIKVLRDAWLSPARRERFASEQRTLAQLNHPLIARLYDADSLRDGTPWFVMEYVEGVPLTDYCRIHSRSIAGRLRLFRDVCLAVQHAHRHLVIHRDLKPSNILVKADGTVKLLDFGIAKQLESLDGPSDQTRTGLRFMTPAYAAPEQIRGGRVGIHTDIYSLGVIMYELIVGRLPFDLAGLSQLEVEEIVAVQNAERPSVAAMRHAEEARVHGVRRSQWADLDVLCLTAMHKDPQRRYATVDALIRDVDHYLEGEPLEARPDSVRYRLGKFIRRNWEVVSAAAFVFVLIVGMAVFYTVRLSSAHNDAVNEAARAQRILTFTLNLFEGGDKVAGPAESLRVVTLVDRGLKEAQTLSSEPAVAAELDLTLGGIYHKLGNFTRADSLMRAGLAKRTSLFGPEHPDVAATLTALSSLKVDQAQFEEAERLAGRGLDVAKRTLSPGDSRIIKAAIALGTAMQERGTYDKAIPVLEDAVALSSVPEAAQTDLASSMSALADVHFYAGHYAVSDSLNQRVLAIHRRVHGDRHPLVSDILINLGATQAERGNYPEAEKLYRQALDMTQSFYGRDHYKTAANLTMVGRVLVNQRKFDDATVVLSQALAIREKVYGPVHPSVASTLNELSTIAYQRDQYDEAEAGYQRMLDIYHSIYGDRHFLIAVAVSNLGSVTMGRKDYVKAEALFRDAFRRYADTQGPEHVNTGIAQIKLGRALLRQGRFHDAQVETLGGYTILAKQANPALNFLQNARKDLAMAYDSLKQPDLAAKFRSEFAATEAAAAAKK